MTLQRNFEVIITLSLSHVSARAVYWTSPTTANSRYCDTWEPVNYLHGCMIINSYRPNDAYVYQYARPSLLQIMAWRLLGVKTLSEPMPSHQWLKSWDQISVKLESKSTSKNLSLKMLFAKRTPLWPQVLSLLSHTRGWMCTSIVKQRQSSSLSHLIRAIICCSQISMNVTYV